MPKRWTPYDEEIASLTKKWRESGAAIYVDKLNRLRCGAEGYLAHADDPALGAVLRAAEEAVVRLSLPSLHPSQYRAGRELKSALTAYKERHGSTNNK